MRITIIGNSGSGKSTLARWLAERESATALDLDTIAFEPGKIAVPRPPDDALADVGAFCETHDQWIVEGCYANLATATLRYQPTLLFVDPGVEICLENCRNRPWEAHKYKSKAEQDEKLSFLLDWVGEYYSRDGDLSLAAHEQLFDGYDGPKERLLTRPSPNFEPPA